MGHITSLEQFHQIMRDCDRLHPPEDYYARRMREKREAEERERERRREPKPQPQLPAQQQSAAERKLWEADWNQWAVDIVERYLEAVMGKGGWLCGAIGQALGHHRHELKTEIKSLRRELLERCARLPLVKAWEPNTVYYTGDIVTHPNGSVYQARNDTGTDPDNHHPHWILLARAGRDGCDGRTPCLRGGFDAHERYRRFDIVTCHDNCYIACCDDPGLPGHDDGAWQLIAKGTRGPSGDVGPRGRKGERGARGEDAPTIVAWTLDRKNFSAVPTMSNGKQGAVLELRGLFEQYLLETSAAAE